MKSRRNFTTRLVAAFDGVLNVADPLFCKLNKTDIPSHNA